jgi:Ca2+-binding RTX toxin-like protein
MIEGLERRVLLNGVVPNTTPLHTGLDTLVKNAVAVVTEVDSIHDKIFNTLDNLPLVGSALKDASGGANDAFDAVSAKIKAGLNAMSGAITGVTIQNAIFAALGPAGLKILPNSVASASDVPITLEDTDSDSSNAEQVDLNLDIQGNLFTATLNPDFKLGLPGLGLKVDGKIQAQVSYDIKLNIAANTSDGLYLDLSPDPEASLKLAITAPGLSAQGNLGFLQINATDGTPSASPTQFTQLVGTISADLSVSGNKLKPSNVGSLLSNSSLSADAEADVHLHNVLSFGGSANFPSLLADLDLTWKLASASLNSGGVNDTHFGSEPDVAFNNIQLDLGSFFSKFVSPIVDEVKSVLKPFQPIVDLLNTRMPIFSDLGPLRDGFGPIPAFDADHNGTVTLLELIKVIEPGSGTTFLSTVVGIDNFVNSIPNISGTTLLPLGSFDLGGATNANGADVRGLMDLTGINLTSFTANDISSELTSIGNTIGGDVGGKIGSFLGEIADQNTFGGGGGDNGGGLKFPILDNPSSAFGLLLGKDVDLFTFDTPTLDLNAKLDVFFPILGPLGVELRGTLGDSKFVEVKAHAKLGYDTYGLREFATTDSFNLSKITDIFDGFFIDDATTSATASFGLEALAALDVVVFSAGVGGGINGTVTLTANDPDDDGNGVDGKLRPKEIIEDFKMGPLCLIDAEGSISASLNAFIRVGFDTPFGFVGWEHDFTLASTTLLDFTAGCASMPVDPPVLATVLGDGTLRLNMGTYAADRLNGDITDDDESFIVTHVSGSAGNETVDVQAFNYVQEYTGVKKIYGEGGLGNDTITIASGVVSPSELWGDFNPSNADNGGATANGNDSLTGGDGPSTMHGGDGDDQLAAGSGAGTMFGDAGKDLLIGGIAADYLDGGEGDDNINGNGGNDSLYGDAGNDYLEGGDGNDTMDGGADNDNMIGDDGNDTMTGDAGSDVLIGGNGADSMDGGAGDDLLAGDVADIASGRPPGTPDDTKTDNPYSLVLQPTGDNDTMAGGDGNDIMYGQGGNDSMTGGNNDDYMEGNAGNDNMDGGAGSDSMIGGQGADSMTGGDNNDVMLGDDGAISSLGVATTADSATDGNDTMLGNAGNDKIFGQGGNDSIIAGAGDDNADGGAGNDKIVGDDSVNGPAGNDSLTGGSGDDIIIGDNGIIDSVTLLGGSGNDTIGGGSGNDLLYGQGGNDIITGDADNDSIIGGQGNDNLDGGTGNDIMLGDDGTIVAGVVTLANSATDGNDTMLGGTGNDTMFGQGGDDDMIGNAGDDSMSGGDGQDVMLGDDGTIAPASPAKIQPETSSVLRIATPASLTDGGNDNMDGGAGNDFMYGQGGSDTMHGGSGDDYMEGNAGADNMSGDAGDDDMIGGSSVAGTPDGGDTMDGGADNDVMLGDNGQITRQVDPATNTYVRYSAVNKLGLQDGAVIRNVTLFADQDTVGGNDTMLGGAGDDIMYGEVGDDVMSGGDNNDQMYGGLGNDSMDGGTGNDGMVGDKGIINPSIFNGSLQTLLVSQGKKISVLIDVNGTINWSVTLIDPTLGGNDSMKGGLGDDAMHGGAGADLMYGDDSANPAAGGNDSMFGDLGNDSMYGLAGSDHIWGGSGDDYLDGGIGNDIIYGGDGEDSLVADNANDYLIDWFGNFNAFFVPGPGFGSPTIIRSPDPNMQNFLLTLANADGATDANGEIAVVIPPSPSNAGPGGTGSH